MQWRLLLGPILAACVAGVFTWDHIVGRTSWPLLGFTLFLAIRSSWELVQLLRTRSFEPHMGLVVSGSALIIASNWFERILSPNVDLYVDRVAALGPTMLTFALVLMALLLYEAARFQKPGNSMESLGAEIFVISYVGILLSLTAQLRWVAGAEKGYLALGSLLMAAKGGDIGGYFLGKFWGRRKLIERLSPGKTWMGALGAVLGAGAFSLLWFQLIGPAINPHWKGTPWFFALCYGFCLGVIGLIGDLCESLIKRDLGKKDSASLFPGFGGLLDILDSVIYSAPVAYLLWIVFPLGKDVL